MNRKLIFNAISNIDDSFIAEAMSPPMVNADHSPERAIKMDNYENTKTGIHSRKLIGLILAASLIFTLAITAYALNMFGIREMFRTYNRELPETADPYIQQHTETATIDGWSAKITESVCDSSRILMAVNVSGGDKYIVVPRNATPDCSVGIIGIEGDQTLGEYAAEQNKELLRVSASLTEDESLCILEEETTFFNVSDNEMSILVNATRTGGEAAGNTICKVYAANVAEEFVPLELPVVLEQTHSIHEMVYIPINPNLIPYATFGEATVEETPLGINIHFMEKVEDATAFQQNIMKVEIDGITYSNNAFVLEDDGNWHFTISIGQGSIGDMMTVHFYDWDKQLIGDIVFKKQ